MEIDEKVLIKKDNLEKAQIKLRGLKVSVRDKGIQSTIDDILKLLNDDVKSEDVSIENMIHDKMKETEFSNPELNFKLYMLYRKLSQNQITEEEALKVYELYE